MCTVTDQLLNPKKPDKMKERVTNVYVKDKSMCDEDVSPDYNLGMTSDQDISEDISNESNDKVKHYITTSHIPTVAINNSVTTEIDCNPPILSNVSSVNLSSTPTIDLTTDTENDIVSNDSDVTNISQNNEISEYSNTRILSVTDVTANLHFQHACNTLLR